MRTDSDPQLFASIMNASLAGFGYKEKCSVFTTDKIEVVESAPHVSQLSQHTAGSTVSPVTKIIRLIKLFLIE